MWLQGDLFHRETAVHIRRWKRRSGHPLSWSDVGEAVSAPSPQRPPPAPHSSAGSCWAPAPCLGGCSVTPFSLFCFWMSRSAAPCRVV